MKCSILLAFTSLWLVINAVPALAQSTAPGKKSVETETAKVTSHKARFFHSKKSIAAKPESDLNDDSADHHSPASGGSLDYQEDSFIITGG